MRTIFQVLLIFIFSFCITGCFNSDDGGVDRISSVSDNNNTISISIPDFISNGNSKFKISGPFKMSLIFTPYGQTSQTADFSLDDIWDSSLGKYVHIITNVPTGMASVILTILDSSGHTIYSYSTSSFDVKAGVVNTLAVTLAPSAVPQVTGYDVHRYFPLVEGYTYTYTVDSTESKNKIYDGNYNVMTSEVSPTNYSYTIEILKDGDHNTCVYPAGISCFAFSSTDSDEEDYYKWSADNKSLYFYGNYDDFFENYNLFSSETNSDVQLIQKVSFESGSPPVLNVADMILGNTSSTATLTGTLVWNFVFDTQQEASGDSGEGGELVIPIRAEQTWSLLNVVDSGAYTNCLKIQIVTKVYDTAINKLIIESTKVIILALDVGIVEQKEWCNNYFYDHSDDTLSMIMRDEETSTLTSFSGTATTSPAKIRMKTK